MGRRKLTTEEWFKRHEEYLEQQRIYHAKYYRDHPDKYEILKAQSREYQRRKRAERKKNDGRE